MLGPVSASGYQSPCSSSRWSVRIPFSNFPAAADVEAVDVETADNAPTQDQRPRDPSGLDTIVVPAREDGFEEVFLGQDRWYQVRIHPLMISQLKYVAVYRTDEEA